MSTLEIIAWFAGGYLCGVGTIFGLAYISLRKERKNPK